MGGFGSTGPVVTVDLVVLKQLYKGTLCFIVVAKDGSS